MAQLNTYRCWFKDGSARLVSQKSHKDAAGEAQELASLANAPAPKVGSEDYPRYVAAVRVVKTELLSGNDPKPVVNWKA